MAGKSLRNPTTTIVASLAALLSVGTFTGCTEDEESVDLDQNAITQSSATNGGENLVLETVFRELFDGESTTPPTAVASFIEEKSQPVANASILSLPGFLAEVERHAIAGVPDAETITFSSEGNMDIDLSDVESVDLSGIVTVTWSGTYIPTPSGPYGPTKTGRVDLNITISANDADNKVTYTNADEVTATWAVASTWEADFEAEWTLSAPDVWVFTAELEGDNETSAEERSFVLMPDNFEGTVTNANYLASVTYTRNGALSDPFISAAFFDARRSVTYTPIDATRPENTVTWHVRNGAIWLTVNGTTDGPLTPPILAAKYGADALPFVP